MKLHKKIIEDAAGGAMAMGDIAPMATPLMGACARRTAPMPKIIKIGKRRKKKTDIYSLKLKEAFHTALNEFQPMGGPTDQNQAPKQNSNASTDTSEVIAKLKGLENKEKVDKHNTAIFGLQDDKGNIVRITVKADQAQSFEQTLQSFLADHEREEGHDGPIDVAEVIFKLKDKFDIVDVDFPEVEEDEEEDVQLPDGEGGAQDPNAPPEGAEPGLDGMGGDMGAPEDDAKSLLTQVIDMMKADAEARKADAHARAAEAKAKEADVAKKTAYAKVKHEEEILDMESYEKAKKTEEKEAKQLARLSKWKREMEDDEGSSFEPDTDAPPEFKQAEDEEVGGDVSDGLEHMVRSVGSQPGKRVPPAPEEEEIASKKLPKPKAIDTKQKISGRVSPSDVASFILSRV